MQEEGLPKLIMEWIPGERRKRGRPRKTWMEGVWVPEDGDSCHKTGKIDR